MHHKMAGRKCVNRCISIKEIIDALKADRPNDDIKKEVANALYVCPQCARQNWGILLTHLAKGGADVGSFKALVGILIEQNNEFVECTNGHKQKVGCDTCTALLGRPIACACGPVCNATNDDGTACGALRVVNFGGLLKIVFGNGDYRGQYIIISDSYRTVGMLELVGNALQGMKYVANEDIETFRNKFKITYSH